MSHSSFGSSDILVIRHESLKCCVVAGGSNRTVTTYLFIHMLTRTLIACSIKLIINGKTAMSRPMRNGIK